MDKIVSPQSHYSRLRQRFLSAGIERFLDYEVIELLLKLADNRRDQKITAQTSFGKIHNSPWCFRSRRGAVDENRCNW